MHEVDDLVQQIQLEVLVVVDLGVEVAVGVDVAELLELLGSLLLLLGAFLW